MTVMTEPDKQVLKTVQVDDPIAKTLLDAADYLEEKGWLKYGLGLHGNSRCVLGAMYSVSGYMVNGLSAKGRQAVLDAALCLTEHVRVTTPRDNDTKWITNITQWNDVQEEAEPVIATLRQAAMTRLQDAQ